MSNRGVSGNKAIFTVGGVEYVTSAVPPGQRISTKEAAELVASGRATPQVKTYADQFPWTKPPK
jgi:hypothetical protein